MIPLSQAYLCCSCDTVGNSAVRCPRCESRALLSVARVLGASREHILEDDVIAQLQRESWRERL